MRAIYSGTRNRKAGHFTYEYPSPSWHRQGKIEGMPWKYLDSALGNLYPSYEEGEAKLTHKGGWTALGFANYMDDQRGNSNSVFAFDAILTFEEALAAAKKYFPDVWEQIAFEVKLVES